MTLKADEIVIPVEGGIVVVDGVTVSQGSARWIPAETGRHYLFFVVMCPGQIAIPPLHGYDVFEVAPDGRISPLLIGPLTSFQYTRELEALGTISKVREYVRSRA